MSTPQNTIAIVYDYDQTLSPSYMQDETVFPAFGINPESFWRRCSELVQDNGYDNELAYMKVLLDTLGMDRPTNAELKSLGQKLNFYNGIPEMFEEFQNGLLSDEQLSYGISVEHYIISSGLKVLIDGAGSSPMSARSSAASSTRMSRAGLLFRSASSATPRRRNTFSGSTKASSICPRT